MPFVFLLEVFSSSPVNFIWSCSEHEEKLQLVFFATYRQKYVICFKFVASSIWKQRSQTKRQKMLYTGTWVLSWISHSHMFETNLKLIISLKRQQLDSNHVRKLNHLILFLFRFYKGIRVAKIYNRTTNGCVIFLLLI